MDDPASAEVTTLASDPADDKAAAADRIPLPPGPGAS